MNSKNNNIILQKNDDNILLEFPLNINNFLFRCTATLWVDVQFYNII